MRVAAAGVCHTDLHLADGRLGEGRWPVVLGHEGAGTVEALGPGVEGLAPGDRVAFCFVPSCGTLPRLRGRAVRTSARRCCRPRGRARCSTARRGSGSRAARRSSTSTSSPASPSTASSRRAARSSLPDALPLWQAALVGCAVVTGVGAVRNAARVARRRDRVRDRLRRRRAPDRRGRRAGRRGPDRRRRPRSGEARAGDGARGDRTRCRPADEAVAAVLALVPGGVDHAFEAVGQPGDDPPGLGRPAPGRDRDRRRDRAAGRRGVAARARAAVREGPARLLLRLRPSGRGDRARSPGLVAAGELPLADVVSHVTDLEGIEDGLERLRAGEGARTVAIMDAAAAGR